MSADTYLAREDSTGILHRFSFDGDSFRALCCWRLISPANRGGPTEPRYNDRVCDREQEHLRHMTDGHWHDDCEFCLSRRQEGGTGLPEDRAAGPATEHGGQAT